VWSRDGRELFYLKGNQMMVVPITPGVQFDFKPAQQLFEYTYPRSSQAPSFDIAADGRFLVIKPSTRATPAITVVSNWVQHLSSR
jgi:hypothetical protein